jgi:hypothetical protein
MTEIVGFAGDHRCQLEHLAVRIKQFPKRKTDAWLGLLSLFPDCPLFFFPQLGTRLHHAQTCAAAVMEPLQTKVDLNI